MQWEGLKIRKSSFEPNRWSANFRFYHLNLNYTGHYWHYLRRQYPLIIYTKWFTLFYLLYSSTWNINYVLEKLPVTLYEYFQLLRGFICQMNKNEPGECGRDCCLHCFQLHEVILIWIFQAVSLAYYHQCNHHNLCYHHFGC